MSAFGPLVSADELRAIAPDPDVVVLDVRWSVDDAGKGRRAYDEGHIPGAVFVDIEDITGDAGAGRHPMPSRGAFEHAMRAAGVRRDSRVVVYDDAGGSVASRVWWLLRIHGHAAVAVLDGGIQSWGSDLETTTPDARPGEFVASEPDLSGVMSYEQVAELGGEAVLIDVRAPARYRGETEPIDPIAGHVPGAKNAFWQDTLIAADGTIHSPSELRERFGALGVSDGNAVVYCGSGIVACQTLLALERAGLGPVRIYAGGWSDWSTREGAPIETGDGS